MYRKMYLLVITVFILAQSTAIISAKSTTFGNPTKIILNNSENHFAPTDISGKWNITATNDGQDIPVVFDFKQEGEDFTGTLSSEIGGGEFKNGKVKENDVTGMATFEVQGQSLQLKLEAKVDGNKIKGTFVSDMTGSIPFSGVKAE